MIGEGATTKVYRDGNTAVKIYAGAPLDVVENEAGRQRFACNAGLPVPAVYGVRKLEGGATALDMEYVSGNPILHPGMDKDERNDAIRALVNLQCQVHKVRAAGLPKLCERLRSRIETQERLEVSQREKILALLENLDDGSDNLCHGDFHPLNVLYDGSKRWIIDWVDAAAGSPLADACRTYLIFKQFISRSAGIYLRTFCKEANARQGDVLAWFPVIAAARLKENMDENTRRQPTR